MAIIRYVAVIFLTPLFWACQSKNKDCRIAKTGTFYYHSLKANLRYKLIRTDSLQTEINLATGDSSFYRIKWKDGCTYNLSFIRTTRVMSDREKEFVSSHGLDCRILTVTSSYFIFKAVSVPDIGLGPLTDTIWLRKVKLVSSR